MHFNQHFGILLMNEFIDGFIHSFKDILADLIPHIYFMSVSSTGSPALNTGSMKYEVVCLVHSSSLLLINLINLNSLITTLT